MKKDTFALLRKLNERIQDVHDSLEAVRDEEEEAYDNLPEGIQMGERGDMMQEAIDTIDEAICSLDDAISSMDIVFDETDMELVIGTNPWDNLKVGGTVIHKTFGEGMVVSAEAMGSDILLEIAFDTVGTKKLMAKFARLTKI